VHDIERCRRLFHEVVEKGNAVAADLCVLHRDGRSVPVEVSANVVEIGGKKLIQAIFRDISRRKAAEEALQKEKTRAEQYLDVAGVIIVVIDADERVSLINKKGSEILGYEEEEIIGKNFFENFIPDRTRAEAHSIFARLLSGQDGSLEYFEFPVITRSGEERILAWYNTLVRDEQGRITGSMSSGEDITARKKAEVQARSRLDHLATLHAIDMIINSSLDLSVTLNEFLAFVTTQSGWDRYQSTPWDTLGCAITSCPPWYLDGADW